MVKINCGFFILLLTILLSNCTPYPTYEVSFFGANNETLEDNEKLHSNEFSTIDGSRVFYSEDLKYNGNYLIENYSDSNKQNINGVGTIKVMVKMVSENNFEEFGIEYGESENSSRKRINFYLKQNGTYTVYWFDNTYSASITWVSSSYIKIGLNEWNELRIDYDTIQKTFSFYINDSPSLLEKTFNYIEAGRVSFYTSQGNAKTIFPYRIEFKTTSPYNYP